MRCAWCVVGARAQAAKDAEKAAKMAKFLAKQQAKDGGGKKEDDPAAKEREEKKAKEKADAEAKKVRAGRGGQGGSA